ncbi:MAG: hypothetical protein ABMA13_01440 [Chthoniobacteraceae bacterium]
MKRFVLALLAAPTLLLAHPGHSTFDPTAGLPHAGHEAETFVVVGLIATGLLLSLRAVLRRRR